MAIDIVERTVNGETEKRLQLSKAYYLRKIKETEWTKLRVFFRISTCRASEWSSPPQFYMGLCAGNAAPGVVASPAHFIGCYSAGTNWSYSSTHGLGVYQNGQQYMKSGKIESGSGSFTNSGDGGVTHHIPIISSRRGVVGFTIRKGSPNWEFEHYKISGIRTIDYTADRYADLINTTDFTETALLNDANYYIRGSVSTIAIDEATYGKLDTVCFSWLGEGAENAFEISDISVKRLE